MNMEKFRIEKGTITDMPVSELNRLNDLAKDLKEKEIELKEREKKLEAEYKVKTEKLEEERRKFFEDGATCFLDVDAYYVPYEFKNEKYSSWIRQRINVKDYTFLDNTTEQKIKDFAAKKVYERLAKKSLWEVRKILKMY